MNLPPGYISLTETARRLHVSRQWLYEHYIKHAGLPVHHFPSGVPAVQVAALEQWRRSYMDKMTGTEETVLAVLKGYPGRSWTAKRLAKKANVSMASVYRVLNKFEDRDIVLHDLDIGLHDRTIQVYSYTGESL